MSDLKVDGVIASTGTNTNLTLQGKGSGKVAIGDGALLFPDADGSANQVIETNASGVLSFVTPSAGGFTLGTEQATTSGTAIAFTGIPSTATQIAITLDGVSTSSDARIGIQIRDSGGLETSGYLSIGGSIRGTDPNEAANTGEFLIVRDALNANTHSGTIYLQLQDSSNNTWTASGVIGGSAELAMSGGSKSLSGTLDGLSLITAATAFDGGAVNIAYI